MERRNDLIADLQALGQPSEVATVRKFFKGDDPATTVMGVSIGKVFPVAKAYVDMSLPDISALLDDPRYEVRMAAVAILDFKARRKKTTDQERAALFNLYLSKHDRINNWDLVDRAAPHVIGTYLVDNDRSILMRLARSPNPHERRTALVATHAFIKLGEIGETFEIAGLLADDRDAYVQKAIASWTREAGKKDQSALVRFLRVNKAKLPRSTITAASKGLPDEVRQELRA